MTRTTRLTFAFSFLALVIPAGVAEAQRYGAGRGYHGGYGHSYGGYYGGYGGYGSRYYGSPYYGYGRTYGGLYYGSPYNFGLYYGPGYRSYYGGYYSTPQYSYQPGYYYSQPNYQPGVAISSDSSVISQSLYGTTGSGTARLRVLLPNVDARVVINDAPTQQTGADRLYVSPVLEPGKKYTYTVQATWSEGGREVTRQKDVEVNPNQETVVSFIADQTPTQP